MNSSSIQVRKIADAMAQFGYVLGNEADNITKADLLVIAETLQANVDSLRVVAEYLPDDFVN